MQRRPKARVKRSIIWQIPEEELRRLIAENDTISAVLRSLGLRHAGGNARTLKSRLDEMAIDYQHMPQGLAANRGIARGGFRYDDEAIFVQDSPADRATARRRLIATGRIPYICAVCSQPPIWQGKPLALILDHINGVYNDHRLENLQFVCPNCNSQLPTHAGRNHRRRHKPR